jgi:hypothetical protein
MPASQGNKGRFHPFDRTNAATLSIAYLHAWANEQDLALAEIEARELRRAVLEANPEAAALSETELYDLIERIQTERTLGRLLEFAEAEELARRPAQIVVAYDDPSDLDYDPAYNPENPTESDRAAEAGQHLGTLADIIGVSRDTPAAEIIARASADALD